MESVSRKIPANCDAPAGAQSGPRSLDLTVVILTLNEAHHLPRAIGSLRGLARRVVVVDSGSTDGTQAIARRMGAELWEHRSQTRASQLNWALAALGPGRGWVLHLGPDEVLTEALVQEIREKLKSLPSTVMGVKLAQYRCFLRRPLRWGGVPDRAALRLFRLGAGRCPAHWRKVAIKVDGPVAQFGGVLLQDNLGDLTRWTEAYNTLASLEVVDRLGRKYRFGGLGSSSPERDGDCVSDAQRAGRRRVPTIIRALCGFLSGYVVRLGFLDGREGVAFHLLRGFWFPFLVEAKLHEVEARMARDGLTPEGAIGAVLGLYVGPERSAPRATCAA